MSIAAVREAERKTLEEGVVNLDAELGAMTADRDAWKAKAERYGYALECIMGSHPAEDEMFNIARAALQEDTP